jgi:aminoglycoside phosphotransferase (APT) family kinase protein
MKTILWQPLSEQQTQILANIVSKPATNREASLTQQIAAQLSAIHQIDPVEHKLGFLPVPRAGHSPAQEQIALCHEQLENADIHLPLLEFVLRWAERYAPKTQQMVVTHGSFSPSAITIKRSRLSTIARWENAHMGDPLEDVAYYGLREWQREREVDRDEWIAAYEAQQGTSLDRQALAYWDMIGNLKLTISRLAEAKAQVNTRNLTIEAAYQARRTAELQVEILRHIEAVGI